MRTIESRYEMKRSVRERVVGAVLDDEEEADIRVRDGRVFG